jgi:hypothetical protein
LGVPHGQRWPWQFTYKAAFDLTRTRRASAVLSRMSRRSRGFSATVEAWLLPALFTTTLRQRGPQDACG